MIFWPNVIVEDKATGTLRNIMTSDGYARKEEADRVINDWRMRKDIKLVSSWIDVIEGVHNIGCIDHICYILHDIDDGKESGYCTDDACYVH